MHHIAVVGAGIGGCVDNTSKLQVMNYKQAMQSMDADGWKHKIDNEHEKMICNGVWEAVEKADQPFDAKVITMNLARKKKANNMLGGQVVTKGFQQVTHQHLNPIPVAAPMANETTIYIALVLKLFGGWATHNIDGNGAFLKGFDS